MPKSGKHANSSTQIRERILRHKGLRIGELGKLTDKLPEDKTGRKSTLIRYVEDKCRKPIEEIIWSGSAREVAEKIEVNPRTIRRWREEFPLNEFKYGKNNRKLPIG